MALPPAKIENIYRYPVKGLSADSLARVSLTPRSTLPADRLYAIENGPSGFDADKPGYLPKQRFLMLMRDERLAALQTRYDEEKHVLTIALDGHDLAEGDLRTSFGRFQIEDFLENFCRSELRGPPRILTADNHSFSDVAKKVVSIINLASVAALGGALGVNVDPIRFRGNLHVSGWPAWSELELVGKKLSIGEARLKVVKRIVRCAATNVNPSTAARDLNIPKSLMQLYGHVDCGIYAEVIAGGDIAAGDRLTLAD